MPADPCDPRLLDLLARWEDLREQGQAVTPEELCGDAPELLPELQRQLRQLHRLDALLPADPGSVEVTAESNGQAALPRNLPGYEILEELGHGGMGVVCKARHLKLNRLVALKLLRAGVYATADELARFRTEAEAVARLQHPHIVQIYESGEHEGRAYIALEYVDGGSLARKIASTPQPAQEAARLVEILAQAMHAAHQHGIIHRDLKPSNVLLTADGVPKLTDFGLAKKLDDVGQTQSGAVMGTPPYMAPEQARGQMKQVGPATDVYALGAILYELLTGRPPFKAESSTETLLQVTNDEPVWPRQLQPKIPRDLETICLKCLEKQPHQRYTSAEALADDLRRFLADELIRARPASRWDKGWKWARRRPASAALLLVSILSTLGFTAGIAGHNVRLQRALNDAEKAQKESNEQRREAQRSAQETQAVADLLAGLFQSADPTGIRALGFRRGDEKMDTLTARQILDVGAKRVEQFEGESVVRARMLAILGGVYRSLGGYDRARKYLEESLTLGQQFHGDEHPDIALSMYHLAWLHQDLAEYREAEQLYRAALAMQEKLLGKDHVRVADTMFNLAWLLAHQLLGPGPSAEHLAEAERLLREVLRIRSERLGRSHRDVGLTLAALAAVLYGRGRADAEAASLLTQAAAIFQGAGHDATGKAITNAIRAELMRRHHRFEEAEQLWKEVVETGRSYLGDKHFLTGFALAALAGVLRQNNKLEAAEETMREALNIALESPLRWHPEVIKAVVELADHVLGKRNEKEAEEFYRKAFALAQSPAARDHPVYGETLAKLTSLLRKQGRHAEAAALRP